MSRLRDYRDAFNARALSATRQNFILMPDHAISDSLISRYFMLSELALPSQSVGTLTSGLPEFSTECFRLYRRRERHFRLAYFLSPLPAAFIDAMAQQCFAYIPRIRREPFFLLGALPRVSEC